MPRGRPCQSARKVTNRAADHARDLAALQGPGDEGPIGGIALTPGTAVLVIDVQPVYWSEVPEARGAFPDLPRNMARLLATARGRGAKVVHVRASYAFNRSSWLQQFAALHPERERVEVEPMDGEPWAAPAPGETVVVKDNFNAFLSVSGAAPGEDLACMLRAMGVDTVLVCGLITSVCVNHTAYGSMLHGFRTAIVSECCGDRTLERHRAALSLYVGYLFPDVTLDNLDRAAAREDDAFASGLNSWAERVAPPSLRGAPAPSAPMAIARAPAPSAPMAIAGGPKPLKRVRDARARSHLVLARAESDEEDEDSDSDHGFASSFGTWRTASALCHNVERCHANRMSPDTVLGPGGEVLPSG